MRKEEADGDASDHRDENPVREIEASEIQHARTLTVILRRCRVVMWKSFKIRSKSFSASGSRVPNSPNA